MFNGQEKLRIIELEAALGVANSNAAVAQMLVDNLRTDMLVAQSAHEAEKATLVEKANEALRQQAANDQVLLDAAHDEALRSEGARDEARNNAARLSDRYDTLMHAHEWKRAGKVHAHGAEHELWECIECRNDPHANVRIIVPPGFMRGT